MIRWAASHPTVPNLLMLLFIVLGLIGLPRLQRATFPDLPPDTIQITVPYPGATPADVEEAICSRIEDALDGIEGISKIESDSLDSLGRVTVEIKATANLSVVTDDVRSEVEAIRNFPDDAEDAVIEQFGRTSMVASVAITGTMPVSHLQTHCENVRRRMLRLEDIQVAKLYGFSDREIQVLLPSRTLARYGLAASDVAEAIRASNVDAPLGTIASSDRDVVIRFVDQRRTVEEYERLIVLAATNGSEVPLGDIAEIREGFEKQEERFSFNGTRAGRIEVKRTLDQDALHVVDAMKAFIAAENAAQPQGVRLHLTQDNTSIVADRLSMLVKNAWQGLLLVFLALWLFLGIRYSFWVAMSLPVSFLGAFYVMVMIGYTLNMLTLVALLLALGLLMDDGIVLAENIASHLAKGKSALRAAIDGTSEVKNGVLSSFATTVIVFTPLSFLEGDIGSVLKVLPVVLIVVLIVSLFEAFLILPGHLAHALERHGQKPPGRFRQAFDRGLEATRERWIGRAVDGFIRWRYLSLGLTAMVFLIAAGVFGSGRLKFQGMPTTDGDVLTARILMPSGTPLERTQTVVQQVVSAFEAVNLSFQPRQPEGKSLQKAVSVQYNLNIDAKESGPHVATVTIDLLSAELRDGSIGEILAAWRSEVGVLADVLWLKMGEPLAGPSGNPIEIEVRGERLETLTQASSEIQTWLEAFEGTHDLATDLRPGKPELRLRMREGGATLGLDARRVAQQLRAALLGETTADIQVGTQSYQITSKLRPDDRDSEADLEYFLISRDRKQSIPLGEIAQITEGRGYSRIHRVGGMRTITVLGDVDTRKLNTQELMNKFRAEKLPELAQQYPDIEVHVGGEVQNNAETMRSMVRGLLLGLLGVFMLLSIQFRSYLEPLLVLGSIPLCLIGVVFGHLLMGLPMTLPSMLGFVSLSGIVVNDSILLVMYLKRARQAGDEPAAAAGRASRARFRAILLTSVTTILGMTPLMFETSLQAQTLIPLAVSIVFGMLTSTLLVLLVIPAGYVLLSDMGLAKAAPSEG